MEIFLKRFHEKDLRSCAGTQQCCGCREPRSDRCKFDAFAHPEVIDARGAADAGGAVPSEWHATLAELKSATEARDDVGSMENDAAGRAARFLADGLRTWTALDLFGATQLGPPSAWI